VDAVAEAAAVGAERRERGLTFQLTQGGFSNAPPHREPGLVVVVDELVGDAGRAVAADEPGDGDASLVLPLQHLDVCDGVQPSRYRLDVA